MSVRPSPATERLALGAVFLACVLWGGSFYAGKVALAELSAVHLVTYRFVLASLVLGGLAMARRLQHRDPRTAPPSTVPEASRYLLTGFLTVTLTHVAQYEGLERTTATSAALLVGTAPPLLALAGWLLFQERLSRSGWLAVALSVVGLGVMVGLPGPGRTLAGDLLVVASILTSVVWVIQTKQLMRARDPVVVTAWVMVFGTLTLLPYCLLTVGLPPIPRLPATWVGIVFLGIGCTAVTYLLWNWGLHHLDAGRAGVFVNLEPLVGTLLGVALLHEPLTPGLIAGGAMILVAAWVISRQG